MIRARRERTIKLGCFLGIYSTTINLTGSDLFSVWTRSCPTDPSLLSSFRNSFSPPSSFFLCRNSQSAIISAVSSWASEPSVGRSWLTRDLHRSLPNNYRTYSLNIQREEKLNNDKLYNGKRVEREKQIDCRRVQKSHNKSVVTLDDKTKATD